MTAYCTVTELIALTGSQELPATLTAVITESTREVDAWLAARGTTGSGDVCKSATIRLCKANLLELGVQKGRYIQNSGEMVNGPDTVAAGALSMARHHRDDAYKLLNEYLATKSSLSTPRQAFVRKVN